MRRDFGVGTALAPDHVLALVSLFHVCCVLHIASLQDHPPVLARGSVGGRLSPQGFWGVPRQA